MRGIGCCIAALAGTLAFASAAGAVTFGTDLSRPADNAYTCADFLGGTQTCSALSSNPYTGESPFPPVGTGVVTRVRVKVGPVTGPMQIVVEEALRQDNPTSPQNPGYFCCKAIDASQVFTPKANAVTEIDVDLPVRQDLTPNGAGVYIDQHLSLSVLAPGVPIPASFDDRASVGLWFPAWDVGDERAGNYGTSGADVLFDAEWQATGGGFSGGGAPLTLADKSAPVDDGKASVALTCNLSKACKGTLSLADRQAIVAPFGPDAAPPFAERAREKSYGAGEFKIKPGDTKTVEAKLKRRGQQLLEDSRKAKAWGNVHLKGSTALAASFRLKLKR